MTPPVDTNDGEEQPPTAMNCDEDEQLDWGSDDDYLNDAIAEAAGFQPKTPGPTTTVMAIPWIQLPMMA